MTERTLESVVGLHIPCAQNSFDMSCRLFALDGVRRQLATIKSAESKYSSELFQIFISYITLSHYTPSSMRILRNRITACLRIGFFASTLNTSTRNYSVVRWQHYRTIPSMHRFGDQLTIDVYLDAPWAMGGGEGEAEAVGGGLSSVPRRFSTVFEVDRIMK